MLVKILIVTSSGLFLSETTTSESMTLNYVTPSKTTPCPNGQRPCLTLKEYASEPDVYFVNNSVFFFHSGTHRLDDSLIRLKNLYNFSFEGLRTGDGPGVANVEFYSLASITWERSWNIEISSICFILRNDFTIIIRFELSQFVQLSNISIVGNGYSGCSSVMSRESTLDINNSTFGEIKGLFGAALMMLASTITFRGTNIFVNNTAASGGSIYLFDCILTLNGANFFLNNTALWYSQETVDRKMASCNHHNMETLTYGSSGTGGAIFCNATYLRVYEHSNFTGNVANSSGGAIALDTGEFVIQANVTFSRNMAYRDGGAMALYNATSDISGKLSLDNNEANKGGAISVLNGTLTIQGYILFDRNSAEDEGGALYVFYANLKVCGIVYYGNNVASHKGGALSMHGATALLDDKCSTYNTVTIAIHNSITFFRNEDKHYEGGSFYCQESSVEFIGAVYFNESQGSAIRSQDSNIAFIGTPYFYRNAGNEGGGIKLSDSNVVFSGTVGFEKNTAFNGGAMALEGTSKLILKPKLNISFILNHADDSGGALYFKDDQCSLRSTVSIDCFITIESDNPFTSLAIPVIISNISLYFIDNSAETTGSVLYGGQFDKCQVYIMTSSYPNTSLIIFEGFALDILEAMSTIDEHDYNKSASISSPAEKIKFCSLHEDTYHTVTRRVYPGEQFNIKVKALGQSGDPVPSVLFTEHTYAGNRYRLSPPNHNINGACTNVFFRLYSSVDDSSVLIKFYQENPCQSLVDGIYVRLTILPCPLGFELSEEDRMCVCNRMVKNFIQNCYIDNTSFERTRNTFWISQTNNTLIFHSFRCPLDYCEDDSINVTLSDPSAQCGFNRTGTLCGQCQMNFSLALGSLHCIPCDNNHAALIIVFALAGVVLIAIIFLLRLTVSVGTLNGLFFYANIIQANHQAFFPRAKTSIFTVFISWLNLDLGIETCFYEGMDIYAYSWFQFLFPFYVWFLIGCIILACRYSQSIAKRLGQNPVAVLATLLLMSFSKILQSIIVPLSMTYLTYYNPSKDSYYNSSDSDNSESHQIIWLYDGSIEFFKQSKHIALGLFALFSLVVFVFPYIFS